MSKYFKYLWVVLRHKWYVFVACWRLGVPFLGVLHDVSKLGPAEFFLAARRFCGRKEEQEEAKEPYKRAWLHHQKANKHHWIYWVVYAPIPWRDYDEAWGCIPMPDRYRREMLADWYGASRTYGGDHPAKWYMQNRHKMLLHPETRAWVEDQLLGAP